MSKFFFIIQCVFLFAKCHGHKEGNYLGGNKDVQSNIIIENNLIGKWGGLDEKTPVWDIRKDSIYYFQHLKVYSYEIINKNMIINFGNSSTVLKNIHVKKDTLFFVDDAGLLIKGYRFKE